jgi:hypothetical protein
LVETTSGSLSGLVNEQRLSELPLNGRNLNDLVLLQTGIKVLVKVAGKEVVITRVGTSPNAGRF